MTGIGVAACNSSVKELPQPQVNNSGVEVGNTVYMARVGISTKVHLRADTTGSATIIPWSIISKINGVPFDGKFMTDFEIVNPVGRRDPAPDGLSTPSFWIKLMVNLKGNDPKPIAYYVNMSNLTMDEVKPDNLIQRYVVEEIDNKGGRVVLDSGLPFYYPSLGFNDLGQIFPKNPQK